MRAINLTRTATLAERVAVADTFVRRGWGLLGNSRLRPGEGMLITNTNCIHSMFMRFPFDAVYLDRDGIVCGTTRQLAPFRVGPLVWRAKHVLELPSGTVEHTATAVGDFVALEQH